MASNALKKKTPHTSMTSLYFITISFRNGILVVKFFFFEITIIKPAMLSSTAISSSSSKKQRVMSGHNPNAEQGPPRGAAAAVEDEAYDQTARELFEEKGFDSDNLNKACCIDGWGSVTPIQYYIYMGDVTMVRYLIVRRGVDCRQTDKYGYFPMFYAASHDHLEICKLLSQVGGAHEDIRKVVTRTSLSPLSIALRHGHFSIVWWLLLNGALSSSPHDAVDGGGFDDIIMRRDLRQEIGGHWQEDKRLTVLAWACDAVAKQENVKVFLTGTIVPAASFRRHPKNPYATRSHKRRKVVSPSPLLLFKGKSGILELIAHYIAGTPQQVHTLRHLVDRLPVFIAEVPFVPFVIEEDDEEDEDEEDY